jgi:DNA-binding transcriptional ArsR family regulator
MPTRESETTRLAGTAHYVGPRNALTGGRRIPWRDLDEKARRRRYGQAVRAHRAGLPGRDPGTFEEYAAVQERLDEATPAAPAAPVADMPPIFGSSARTQILAILAVNGPVTVRELARLRGVDSATTFRAAERLIDAGLAVKRDEPGGRKYVALNRAQWGGAELRALLVALADACGVPRLEQARYRWRLPTERDPKPPIDPDAVFGTKARSRALLVIAAADVGPRGHIDERRIAATTQTGENSVWHAVNALEDDGVVSSRRAGRHRLFALSRKLPGVATLREFARRLLDGRPDYAAKAALAPILAAHAARGRRQIERVAATSGDAEPDA